MTHSKMWIKRHLLRAKRFEMQKATWKIFFLERRDIRGNQQETQEKVSHACQLLQSLGGVCIPKLTAELQDRRNFLKVFDDIATSSRKDFTSEQMKAKLLLVKSKPFARALKTLYNNHISGPCKPLSSKEISGVGSTEDEPMAEDNPLLRVDMKGLFTHSSRSTKTREVKDTTIKQPKKLHKGASVHPSSGRNLDRPSTLDSVFVGSLSASKLSGAKHKHKKRPPKNRLGQRARRQLAEKVYGTVAKHLKEDQRSQLKTDKIKRFGSNKRQENNAKTKISGTKNTSRQTQFLTNHTIPKSTVEKLHPSWAASKKRKEMESKIPKAQGQRIVFEDSD